MSKILENENIVERMINGIVLSSDTIKNIDNIILKKVKNEKNVAIISGGGAGHEPAHTGFVADGLLDAVVVGDVFSSPSPDKILKAIEEVATPAGVIMIVKNYSGDIMNFELASNLASLKGINVKTIVSEDDISTKLAGSKMGSRGVAGTILLHKVCGYYANEGYNIDEIVEKVEKFKLKIHSIGVGFSPCYNPVIKKNMNTIGLNEYELGIGIHGERGVEIKALTNIDTIINDMINPIVPLLDKKQDVAVIINGLGGATLMEQYVIADIANEKLNELSFKICDIKVGNYMTSLDMDGFTITLCNMDEDEKIAYFGKVGNCAW